MQSCLVNLRNILDHFDSEDYAPRESDWSAVHPSDNQLYATVNPNGTRVQLHKKDDKYCYFMRLYNDFLSIFPIHQLRHGA
jgi:hypothetical protein